MRLLKTSLVLAVAGTVALTGCTETGPRQQTGAAAGAFLGGLFGATRKGGNVGTAVVGATIGGIVGGAIGQSLDRQAGDLRSSVSSDIKIVNTGSELIVVMPNDLLFATDSDAVQPGLQRDLAALAKNLKDYPNSTVEVIGHTDNVGAADYNLGLSRRRAASVAAVLFSNGVSPSRVVTIGKGESTPVATNLTPEGRAQNRRVEIVIRPNA